MQKRSTHRNGMLRSPIHVFSRRYLLYLLNDVLLSSSDQQRAAAVDDGHGHEHGKCARKNARKMLWRGVARSSYSHATLRPVCDQTRIDPNFRKLHAPTDRRIYQKSRAQSTLRGECYEGAYGAGARATRSGTVTERVATAVLLRCRAIVAHDDCRLSIHTHGDIRTPPTFRRIKQIVGRSKCLENSL